jgi:hypothetical protein
MELKYKLVRFVEKGDSRGKLVILEGITSVPFDIKRVFYTYNTAESVQRGSHANRNTKFMLISVSGSCTVEVNCGKSSSTFTLDSPVKGLFLNTMVWKEIKHFSADNILLCLCSEHYDPNEYIFDLTEFFDETNEN